LVGSEDDDEEDLDVDDDDDEIERKAGVKAEGASVRLTLITTVATATPYLGHHFESPAVPMQRRRPKPMVDDSDDHNFYLRLQRYFTRPNVRLCVCACRIRFGAVMQTDANVSNISYCLEPSRRNGTNEGLRRTLGHLGPQVRSPYTRTRATVP
jgi:hypothetical protein